VFFNQLPFYASRTKSLWRPLGCKITTTFGSKCSSEEGTKKRKEQNFINFKKKTNLKIFLWRPLVCKILTTVGSKFCSKEGTTFFGSNFCSDKEQKRGRKQSFKILKKFWKIFFSKFWSPTLSYLTPWGWGVFLTTSIFWLFFLTTSIFWFWNQCPGHPGRASVTRVKEFSGGDI